MLPRNHPDRIRIVFDDHRLVANAGLLLPATLARHLGLRELVDHHLDLGGAPGRANTGDKLDLGNIGRGLRPFNSPLGRWGRKIVTYVTRNLVDLVYYILPKVVKRAR